jgi:hypothetical protein
VQREVVVHFLPDYAKIFMNAVNGTPRFLPVRRLFTPDAAHFFVEAKDETLLPSSLPAMIETFFGANLFQENRTEPSYSLCEGLY